MTRHSYQGAFSAYCLSVQCECAYNKHYVKYWMNNQYDLAWITDGW